LLSLFLFCIVIIWLFGSGYFAFGSWVWFCGLFSVWFRLVCVGFDDLPVLFLWLDMLVWFVPLRVACCLYLCLAVLGLVVGVVCLFVLYVCFDCCCLFCYNSVVCFLFLYLWWRLVIYLWLLFYCCLLLCFARLNVSLDYCLIMFALLFGIVFDCYLLFGACVLFGWLVRLMFAC